MIEEKQRAFTIFMEEFVKLNIKQKNNEIIEKQKEILTFLLNYATLHGIDYVFLKSDEIIDIERTNSTNEDYLEALMVYSENIGELLGLILGNMN